MVATDHCMYDRKFERLSARNISMISVFASYKYFRQVEDELRIDLTFKSNILYTARQWLETQTPHAWKDKQFARVVIHVRRTDHITSHRVREGCTTPTSEYFHRSMSYFTHCFDRVQFVILTDDIAWCRKHINASNIVYSSGHSAIIDMAIASLCDHAIITVGTYGWWAAWFANGVTITQKNFPRKGSKLSKRCPRTDQYKPNWIGI